MTTLKSWLLSFFAFSIVLTLLPIAAREMTGRDDSVSVMMNGEVRKIPREEFVASALLAEGYECESIESKKALAVAIRSCAEHIFSYGGNHDGFDFCDKNDCCFLLSDLSHADEQLKKSVFEAVDSTRGVILTFENVPALSLFCLCTGSSGSKSENPDYLTPIREETRCEVHKTEKNLPYENLLSDKNNTVVVYDENGDCDFAVWDGKYVSGAELAEKLSLPSTEFTLEFRADGIFVTAYGVGNGLGMNLCGAERMAKEGKNFEEILAFYYPKLAVSKTD